MWKLSILAVLALAACNEHAGVNPNYTMNATPYGDYQRARELALNGQTRQSPAVIPVQLPAQAPTAADIAGNSETVRTGATKTQAAARPQVPARPQTGASGPYPGSTPVLVRYAHAERQNPGTRTYQRSATSQDAAERACRAHANADAAQTAFIAAGGPVIDPHGMDPDGDGFVCGWDPRPYRQPAL